MSKIVPFESRRVSDIPEPSEECRPAEIIDIFGILIPGEYELEFQRIPPADRKWRCLICLELATFELVWWMDGIKVYVPQKVRSCFAKSCKSRARKLSRKIFRQYLEDVDYFPKLYPC